MVAMIGVATIGTMSASEPKPSPLDQKVANQTATKTTVPETKPEQKVSMENQTVYISTAQLMGQSKGGQEANKELGKVQARIKDKVDKQVKGVETAKAEYQKIVNEFETKKGILKDLSGEEKKVRDAGRKVANLEGELKESAQDAENEFRAEYMRLSEQLFQEQIETINEWAKECKVAAVVDSDSGRVLYRRDSVDATNQLLPLINKKHDIKVAKAKVAAPAPTQTAAAKKDAPAKAA